MPRRAKEYERLPGRRRRWTGSTRLWLGRDHLLIVLLQGFTETYRRLYFRDIQSIIVRQTKRTRALAILFGFATLNLAATQALGAGPVLRAFWGFLSALLYGVFALHWLRGPTCVCHLRTVLQVVELSSLHRLRTARRALSRIRPAIALAQGMLSREELEARLDELPPAPHPAPASAAAATPAARHDPGRLHEILCYLLLLDALTMSFQASTDSHLIDVVAPILFLAECGVAIGAIVKQRGTDIVAALRFFPGMTLGFVFGVFILAQMHAMLQSLAEELTTAYALRLDANPVAIVSVIGSLLLSFWGFILLRAHRRSG